MTIITIGGRAGATFSGMEDSLLISDFPTNNYNAEPTSQGYAFCLRPDLSGIPGGSTIVDAFWTFGVASGAGDAQTITIKRLLRAWVEAQASYNNYSTGNAWTTAGAGSDGNDRVATNSATGSYPGGFSTADITSTGNTTLIADIQGMVDSSLALNGWLFTGPVSLGLPANSTAALRPLLTVEYTSGGSVAPIFHYLDRQRRR